jgi:hypothetical protein
MSERPGPGEDRPSVLDQIKDLLPGDDDATPGRSIEDDCDECGVSEGSVIHLKDWPGDDDERYLCRSCYNDPEVWPDD